MTVKINNINNVQSAYGVYNKDKVKSASKVGPSNAKAFDIEISGIGKDYNFAMEKLKEVPEIRREKIDKISNEIANGTYTVDAKKLAKAIVSGITVDDIV